MTTTKSPALLGAETIQLALKAANAAAGSGVVLLIGDLLTIDPITFGFILTTRSVEGQGATGVAGGSVIVFVAELPGASVAEAARNILAEADYEEGPGRSGRRGG